MIILSLDSLSPLDGRYNFNVNILSDYFSEGALIKNRIKVECSYLFKLIDIIQPETKFSYIDKQITPEDRLFMMNLHKTLSYEELDINVKNIEAQTNHDVKAVEYYLKMVLDDLGYSCYSEWIHLGLTSEDINNVSYAIMLKDSLTKVIKPYLINIMKKLSELVEKYSHIPMLTRTHGQPATPSTIGKELAVYLNRLIDEYDVLNTIKIKAKLNGAIGNHNALSVALSDYNWLDFSQEFIKSFDLEPNIVTTQIESHDSFSRVFDSLVRLNNIIQDMNVDIWYYISLGYFKLNKKDEEVGSSTMPHKINPIDFENSEGNIGLSNSILKHMSEKLTKSRMQRDLSDSTVLRSIGSALGYSLMAYKSCLKGLNKITTNNSVILNDLESHPEVLAEAIQTILRVEGVSEPYELLKSLTRGNDVSKESLNEWINNLDISESIKNKLLDLDVKFYIGYSTSIIEYVLNKYNNFYQ